jgi:hypothetical protein
MSLRIERLLIPGPAGRLEAVLELDPNVGPQLTALVCHPHPLYGGTRHNKVVYRAAKGALQAGLPTLRFNFRGAGKSEGKYAAGAGDVRAALDFLQMRFPAVPVCLMGFSFGAWVGLEAGVDDARVGALVALGLPTAAHDVSFLRATPKPKLIIQGTQDVYGPRPQVEEVFASALGPKRLHWVEGADHFFAGKLGEIQATVRAFLQELLAMLPRAASPE